LQLLFVCFLQSFNDAYNLVKVTGKREEFSPFLFRNQTGYDIVLKLDPSFEVGLLLSLTLSRLKSQLCDS
jgi:hypothetical protein